MKHQHGHSLADDLPLIEKQLLERRKVLRLFALSGAAALLPGCGGGANATAATATPTPSAACVIGSSETNGPYPADGTNTSNGSTSNVLALAGAVRSDLRASFINTSTVAAGVRLDLTIKLVNAANAANACAALAGYVIYLWHCDGLGRYSLYDLPNESYLRGIGLTDASGQVSFTTIFPGAYAGRYPHMHLEVFSSLAAATSGRSALLVSQFALPAAQAQAVYADSAVYGNSATRLGQTPLAADNVFGDNTAAQIAQQTITLSGAPASGYAGTVLVGVKA